jgi:hypothetical protein
MNRPVRFVIGVLGAVAAALFVANLLEATSPNAGRPLSAAVRPADGTAPLPAR